MLSPGFKTWPKPYFIPMPSLTDVPCMDTRHTSLHLFHACLSLCYRALGFCSWE